jgi:hypothetical protein
MDLMGEKVLMKGNEAIAEAAILAGCRYFFGYPITPQNEIPEYMSRRMPEVGGVFLQAESEVAGSNMVYGAACAGARVMTTSSSPGISLMQEAISYMAGAELPCVLVNIVRGGPGLGGIQGSQADYFQATKGGGHGDYKLIVLAPASVQELMDLTITAFDLADVYRNPVMILGDAILGQMMEPVILGKREDLDLPPKTWVTTGAKNRPKNVITSLILENICDIHFGTFLCKVFYDAITYVSDTLHCHTSAFKRTVSVHPFQACSHPADDPISCDRRWIPACARTAGKSYYVLGFHTDDLYVLCADPHVFSSYISPLQCLHKSPKGTQQCFSFVFSRIPDNHSLPPAKV